MDAPNLAEIVGPENVAVGFAAANRAAVVEKLVDLLGIEKAATRREVEKAVEDREELQATGIGMGIAIPHGKAAIEPDLLASIVLTAEPVEYGSVDGTPVRIFILVVSRHDVTGPHVQALAHVARLLGHRSFREQLLACGTPEEVVRLVKGEEAK